MIYPKIQIYNNRYRGPLESLKDINLDIQIEKALEEISLSLNKTESKINNFENTYFGNDYISYINEVNENADIIKKMESEQYAR